jgi:hypothetical protein
VALGLLVAFLSLAYWRFSPATPAKMVVPLLLAILPLLDATLAIVRRLNNRVSPLYGG